MNKKISTIVILFVIISILLTGCIYESNSVDIISNSTNNFFPVAIISAPHQVYFGDIIEFDATNSYDSDGNIVYYYWMFGDGDTSEEEKTKHSYKFENDLNIDYPLIYTVSLLIIDNKGAATGISHEIKVYPSKYLLFFQPSGLKLEKPSFSEDYVIASFGVINQNPSYELTYKLKESINISDCTWNAIFYLKKPWFARLSKIKMVLYDINNNEISKAEKKLGIFRLWNKKTIEFEGKIEYKAEFQSIKLFIYGFSFRKSISISYGSKEASYILFNFED